MKHIPLLLVVLFMACNSTKKLEKKMNPYLGQSKADIMLVYGHAPVKDGFIDGLGRALVYSNIKTSGLGIYSQQYYQHTMFVFDDRMKCIAWSVRNEQMPFDRLDVRIFRN